MLNLDIAQPIELDFIASSIGAITIEFLQMLYLAAQGDDGLKEFGWRTITTARRKHSQDQDQPERLQLIQEIENNFRLYFPSRDTVLNSKGGVECGGPICFSSRWYNAPSFPQKVLRDCKSVREGLLMHNKVSHQSHLRYDAVADATHRSSMCRSDRLLLWPHLLSIRADGHISVLRTAPKAHGASLFATRGRRDPNSTVATGSAESSFPFTTERPSTRRRDLTSSKARSQSRYSIRRATSRTDNLGTMRRNNSKTPNALTCQSLSSKVANGDGCGRQPRYYCPSLLSFQIRFA